ncbi:MAG TPA: hypothetical protein PK467_14705 [Candidatus Wallbacteria bacterium]|nr:hypothetical protein [Candidatus Wallbacteria bacterium]
MSKEPKIKKVVKKIVVFISACVLFLNAGTSAFAVDEVPAHETLETSAAPALKTQPTLAAEQISRISDCIDKFIDNVCAAKMALAVKQCVNPNSPFLSKSFLDELKGLKGKPLKIKDISGAPGDTISVVLEFEGESGGVMTQEFIMQHNIKNDNFLIANIFERLYEVMGPEQKNCLANCSFLETSLFYYQRTLPDFAFSKEFKGDGALKIICDGAFLKTIPECPSSGKYSCRLAFNADVNAYEIMIGCSLHGTLAEVSKLYTSLDDSEKFYAALETSDLALAKKHCGDRLLKMFESRAAEKTVFEFIRNDNIGEAFAEFRKLQAGEKFLGEMYPALADALMQINHETEAVMLLKEASQFYPRWQLIINKLKEGGN